MKCDAQYLSDNSACFRCIPKIFRREVMIYLLCSWANSKGTPPAPDVPAPEIIDADVTNWSDRVVSNGGAAPSAGTLSALSTFAKTLKSADLWNKMKSVNCFVPDSLIASVTPLIKVVGSDPWTQHNFVTGDLSVNGLTGDAASKWLDTGINPSTHFSTDNMGMSMYSYLKGGLMGAGDNYSNCSFLLTGTIFDCWDNAASRSYNNDFAAGFSSGNRLGANSKFTYNGNNTVLNQVASNTTASTYSHSDINHTISLFAFNTQGGQYFFGGQTASFAAVHTGLTLAQAAALYSAVLALRTALGGGYLPFTSSTHPVVANWYANVRSAGGAAPSAGTLTALNNFWNGLVTDNIASKMVYVMPLSPTNLTEALAPLVLIPGGNATSLVNHGFASGDLSVNGLLGGGLKYLDLGYAPNQMFAAASDGGCTVYLQTNDTAAIDGVLYCALGSSSAMGFQTAMSGAVQTTYAQLYSQNVGAGMLTAPTTGFTGYLSINRGTLDSSNLMALYAANSSIGHTTLVSSTTSQGGTLPTDNLFAYAQDANGPPIQYCSKRLSFIAVHSGLTTSESANFYARIQTLRAALGGGFV